MDPKESLETEMGQVLATHCSKKKLQVGSAALYCSLTIALLEVCLALAVVTTQQAEQLKVQTAALAGVHVARGAVVHGLAEVVLGLMLVPKPVGRS